MKKIIFTIIFASSLIFSGNINAQSYSSAVGAKLGGWLLGTYKKEIKESTYVDLYGGFYSSYSSSILLGGSLELHKDIESVNNLYWYYGAGASLTLGSGTGIGINGVLGLDYSFEEIPLNLSADWMPGFFFGGTYKGPYFGLGAFSARYILSEN